MALIDTIETDPISPFGEPEVPPAEWTYRHCVGYWRSKGSLYLNATLQRVSENARKEFRAIPEFPKGQSLERSVSARVDHGRWLWDCPICNAAQVCSEVDSRAFCVGCFNGGDGWWPVEWPKDRDAIETLLARREKKEQRSWRPHEPVEMLQAENLQVGADPRVPSHPWHGADKALEIARKVLADKKRRALEAP